MGFDVLAFPDAYIHFLKVEAASLAGIAQCFFPTKTSLQSGKSSLMETEFSICVMGDEHPEDTFLKNIRFAEYWQRERARGHKLALRDRLRTLFGELPKEVVDLITDDQESLIAEMVRTRNSLIHADDVPGTHAATGARLEAVATKLGVMLMFHLVFVDHGEDFVKTMVSGTGKNPALYKYLSRTDRPDDRHPRLPSF